jgi:hypothetical protein
MTLAEKIWGSSIGAFIAYGKTTAAAALKPLLVTDNGDGTGTLVVSASSSALPAGAATAANQAAGNASLSSMDGKLPAMSGGKIPVEATVEVAITELNPHVLTHVNIDFSSATAQTIIAAPAAGNRLRIAAFEFSALVNVEVAMISGSTTIGTYRGQAVVADCTIPINLGTAEAFKLDATTADRITGRVSYYSETV